MDDKIELKTEHSLPAKTERTDDEMALSLASDETLCLTVNSGNEFNKINHSDIQQPAKDKIVTSSQYLTAETAGTDISESNYLLKL